MNTENIWVIMYSKDRNCYHVETLGQTVVNSRVMLRLGISNDYMIIGVCETGDEAYRICNEHEKINPLRDKSELSELF